MSRSEMLQQIARDYLRAPEGEKPQHVARARRLLVDVRVRHRGLLWMAALRKARANIA